MMQSSASDYLPTAKEWQEVPARARVILEEEPGERLMRGFSSGRNMFTGVGDDLIADPAVRLVRKILQFYNVSTARLVMILEARHALLSQVEDQSIDLRLINDTEVLPVLYEFVYRADAGPVSEKQLENVLGHRLGFQIETLTVTDTTAICTIVEKDGRIRDFNAKVVPLFPT